MSAIQLAGQTAAPEPLLRTLVLCDLADSTALVERLGDSRTADLMRRHDRTARLLMHRHGGQEIDKTDGFLVLFERPIHAIAFALDYHDSLRDLSVTEGETLRARVGVHVGDVVVWSNTPADVARGAKPHEVEGLAKPVAARLMGLALPGQTLVSATVVELAKRSEQALRERFPGLQWRNHGLFRFKGVPDPAAVYEVAADTAAPLSRPPNSEKAKRHVAWWRRPIVIATELTAIAAIGIGVLLLTLPPKPAIAFAERDWIVVGDLRNLTNKSLFDDSIETAFRISLEQSQFVNVIPELQVRDALARMKREPGTVLDRAVASEIALRDGARAVVLPTVAEVGGRLRVSAEVVDPNTQTTVYAESEDGEGVESVLPSIDRVARTLRGKLGESIASIDNTTQPLERVATSNLDALRAFGLGQKAHATGRHADAQQLIEHAIELDPDFASAYLRLASFYMASDRGRSRELVLKAGANRDRLTARDRLHLDAYAASLRSPLAGLEQWRLMASLYPDFYAGQQNSALQLWQYANRPREAIPLLREVTASQHPLRAVSWDLLGHVALAASDLALARESYANATSLSFPSLDYGPVALAMAERDEEAATAALQSTRSQPIPAFELYRNFRLAMRHLDRGDVRVAMDELESTIRAAEHGGFALPGRRFTTMASILAASIGSDDPRWPGSLSDDTVPAGIERYERAFLAAAMAIAGLERNDEASVDRMIALATDGVELNEYPALSNLVAVARARQALAAGDIPGAEAAISKWADEGLFVTRATRLRIAIARRDLERAQRAADDLESNRSAALGEWAEGYVLQPLNIVETARADLQVAELAIALGDAAAARARIESFRRRWPALDPGSAPGQRAARVDAALASLLDEHPHP
jgi:putative peptide modification system cyclase